MKIYKHEILTALMVDVVMYVFRHADCDEAIVKCAVEALNDDYHASLMVIEVVPR
jgi:hypothetical protein